MFDHSFAVFTEACISSKICIMKLNTLAIAWWVKRSHAPSTFRCSSMYV